MRQQAALVEGSRDQPRHDGEPCAGEQQLHSVTINAPEPERAGRSSKNQPLEPGLSSACRKTPCRALARARPRQSDTNLRSLDIERNSFNELPEKFKAVASYRCVAFCSKISRPRCAAASPRAGRSHDTPAGERRWSRGDRSRAAARPPFSPPGSAADFPSRPGARSADQAAPAAAASDWRLPETASRARHRVARRGRVSRCTS